MADKTGDDELDQILAGIESAAKMDAANNRRIVENHLELASQVIANKAALKADADASRLVALALGNPT